MKYKVKFFRLDDMGRGICKIDDKITFVNNLLPLEEAYVEVISSKKNYNVASVLEYIKKSPDRIEPKCPYLNCGCHLKHLDYEKQLLYKKEKVNNILNKFGDINITVDKIISDKNIYGYRNKITLKIGKGVGYHSNGSNEFIHINRCDLVSDRVNELIDILNKEDLSNVNSITIKDFDELMVDIDGKMDVDNISKYVSNIYMDGKLIKGVQYIETHLNNLTFKVSKDSFFQVNKNMIEKLYDVAMKYLNGSKEEKIIDLYCGTGTINLLLSKHFKEIIGVEINSEAIKCANINKEINNIKNVNFICGDASLEIGKLKADKLIVDPPRSGLSKKGIKDILKLKPKVMVYISCDPITLARDLKLLSDNYDVSDITLVDMFPNTYHVETVVKIVRKK